MAQVDSWQEKYLKSLDEQDRLEQLNAAQAHLMRRMIVSLGAAAAGLDPELDEAILRLKEKMRGAKGSAVHDQVLVVEHAVRNFTDHRDGAFNDILGSLNALLNSLNSLAIPDPLKVTLLQYIKQISHKHKDQTFHSIAESLRAIESLHNQALSAAQVTEVGFWQRLRGQKRLQGANEHSPSIDDLDRTVAAKEEIETDFEERPDTSIWLEARATVIESLQAILAEFSEAERASEVWVHASAFLSRLSSWHELTEVFDDLRKLVSARSRDSDPSDTTIAIYLEQLNRDLNDICQQLGVNLQRKEKYEQAAKQLEHTVTEQVADISISVDRAENLEGLKSDIRSQVAQLQGAMEHFQRHQKDALPLADELQKLMEKVQSMETESERTKKLLEEQSYKALHDALTELPNREAYNQRVQQEWQRFVRYGGDLCLALVDIDHFKRLNDQFGHRVGDRVLKVIAQSLKQRLRKVDFIARYGGEEFIVLLPETELHDAIKLLDQIRDNVAKASFRVKSHPIQITFSSGVTAFCEGDEVDSVVERADRALYRAKNDGRNRVCRGDD